VNTRHRLDALHGENPLAFLAALGALTLLSRNSTQPPRLAWAAEPPHTAALETPNATPEELVADLFQALTATDAPTPQAAVGPRKLKELTLDQYRAQMAALDDLTAGLLAGMCSDATNGEKPERGPLIMTSGPQDFPASVGQARAALGRAGAGRVAEALFGPWAYVDGHPLGFDPLMEKRHAYLAAKPERDAQHVPAALVLAATALASLPLYPTAGRRGFTNVLCKDGRWSRITWPLWETPLTLPEAASVLAGFDPMVPRREQSTGLAAAYAAERGGVETAGGVYYVLRAGRRLW
jgi:hypothetical protein